MYREAAVFLVHLLKRKAEKLNSVMVLVGAEGACLEFTAPIRSIIRVFQHPVTVDRWIIIFSGAEQLK